MMGKRVYLIVLKNRYDNTQSHVFGTVFDDKGMALEVAALLEKDLGSVYRIIVEEHILNKYMVKWIDIEEGAEYDVFEGAE